MDSIKILWVDDEIELLKPHFLFLGGRGYTTSPCTNGQDAIDLINQIDFDIVLLDENMPGLNGLETLTEIKKKRPELPVIMITKNEEEHIMDEAIGSKIADYLIKPVNPNQILLALKKIFNKQNIISEKIIKDYQKEFLIITNELSEIESHEQWFAFYDKMLFWELELESLDDKSMLGIFKSQMKEANLKFSNFVEENYENWINGINSPVLSNTLFEKKILPELNAYKPSLLLVIDNLRLDQWKVIASEILKDYKIRSEESYLSILPTATQYSRNAIFSGMTPMDMEKNHPDWWRNENEIEGKNMFEKEFLTSQLNKLNFTGDFSYHKITKPNQCKHFIEKLKNHSKELLTVVVFNFIDMISHARTEMDMIKELTPDTKAYRSLTLSWFKNSSLIDLIQSARKIGFNLLLTTDHGTINVETPISIVSDKSSSSSLRYKTGKSFTVNSNKIIDCKNPHRFKLPKLSINSSYIFAKQNQYFVYKNNYNKYVNFYRNSFQHGGISMEEMIIPFVSLIPKS